MTIDVMQAAGRSLQPNKFTGPGHDLRVLAPASILVLSVTGRIRRGQGVALGALAIADFSS